jgi:hypothetical protein
MTGCSSMGSVMHSARLSLMPRDPCWETQVEWSDRVVDVDLT